MLRFFTTVRHTTCNKLHVNVSTYTHTQHVQPPIKCREIELRGGIEVSSRARGCKHPRPVIGSLNTLTWKLDHESQTSLEMMDGKAPPSKIQFERCLEHQNQRSYRGMVRKSTSSAVQTLQPLQDRTWFVFRDSHTTDLCLKTRETGSGSGFTRRHGVPVSSMVCRFRVSS